jgi:glutamate racemase
MAGAIGVFDSGVGGLSILGALRAAMPQQDFVYFADNAFAPYGERAPAWVAERAQAVTAYLQGEHGLQLLVIACNTATAAAVDLLRSRHPDLPVVGVEPAIKPALQQSRTGRIGVMATRVTLQSKRFERLLSTHGAQGSVVLQACDGLAEAIEQDDASAVQALCAQHTQAMGRFGGQAGDIDTLVLGCTHYPLIKPMLARMVGPQVTLIDTADAVARRTRALLGLSAEAGTTTAARAGRLRLLGTGPLDTLQRTAARALSCSVDAELIELSP